MNIDNLAGCAVTQQHFDSWGHVLVADAAPYFLTDDLLPLMPADIPCFPRHLGIDQQLPLALRDSYTIYRVDQACQYVVFLTDAALSAISPHIREQLLYTQWRNLRGQVYDVETFAAYLRSNPGFEQLNHYTIDTEAGPKCVLSAPLWRSFSAQHQERWLRQYIVEQQHPYPTLALARVAVPTQRTMQLNTLANSFALNSGPNCFATTLAAITETAEYVHAISALWLHQDMFLHGLAIRGYVHNPAVDACTEGLSDSVVVWCDDAGMPRHACWLIGRGVALNKNGQAWYDPRHLAAIRDILAYWQEDNYQVQVYTRSAD